MEPAATLMSQVQMTKAIANDGAAEIWTRHTWIILSKTVRKESTRHITVKRPIYILAVPPLPLVLNMLGYIFSSKFVFQQLLFLTLRRHAVGKILLLSLFILGNYSFDEA